MHTGRRDQLHLNRLEDFAKWAEGQGYVREPVKGDYEVLRLRRGKGRPNLFWRHTKGEHATTDSNSQPLVDAWMGDR